MEGKKDLKSPANWIESGPGFSFLGRYNVVTWLLQVSGQTGSVWKRESLSGAHIDHFLSESYSCSFLNPSELQWKCLH